MLHVPVVDEDDSVSDKIMLWGWDLFAVHRGGVQLNINIYIYTRCILDETTVDIDN
jgi:hypothetical protein